MTHYLLDTHVLLWLSSNPQKISPQILNKLKSAENLYASAASSYEIAHKFRLGKLPSGGSFLERWEEFLLNLMGKELPLTHTDMKNAGLLAWQHRDPFDRMLVASAQKHGLILVTRDQSILNFNAVSTLEC